MISFKFPLQPQQKYYITQYEELGFSLLTQMTDDCTTNYHYLTYIFLLHISLKKVGRMCFLNLGLKGVISFLEMFWTHLQARQDTSLCNLCFRKGTVVLLNKNKCFCEKRGVPLVHEITLGKQEVRADSLMMFQSWSSYLFRVCTLIESSCCMKKNLYKNKFRSWRARVYQGRGVELREVIGLQQSMW